MVEGKAPQQTTGRNSGLPAEQAWRLGQFVDALVEAELGLQASDCAVLQAAGSSRTLAGLTSDSRQVSASTVFLSLAQELSQARQHCQQAIDNGALFILAACSGIDLADAEAVPIITVDNLMVKASAIAGLYFRNPRFGQLPPAIYGITGTNGKTSCSWFLANAASKLSITAGIIGTLGYGVFPVREHQVSGHSTVTASSASMTAAGEAGDDRDANNYSAAVQLVETGYTTPDAVETQRIIGQLRQSGCLLLAMEVSSHALVQARVAAVNIGTAIFTNLSREHLDYHGDMQSYADAKSQLFAMRSVQYAVINLDDAYARDFIAALHRDATYLTYSLHSEKADVHVIEASYLLQGMRASIHTPFGQIDLQSPLIGDFNLGNLLAVIAALLINGHALDAIQGAVDRIDAPPGRVERVVLDSADAEQDIAVVVDYAHTPDALEKVLGSLQRHSQGQLCCVFGCGGDRDRGKRAEMAAVVERFCQRAVVTVDNSRSESKQAIVEDILAGFSSREQVALELDRGLAIEQAILTAKQGDIVLIAGKGHEQSIDEAGRKLPFNDLEQARQALERRLGRAA